MDGRHQQFFAKHPLAQLAYHGGATLPSPRIIGIFLGDDKLQRSTEALLQSFGCTPYWRDAVAEYGIGDALYERTVPIKELPVAVVNHDYAAFVAWIRDSAAAKVFGEVRQDDVLLFFLPPKASVRPDDCTGRLGGHSSVLTADKQPLRYAYFPTCLPTANAMELLSRTHAVTHELMEMATDPDPDDNPGWRALGPGLVAASIRPSTSSLDDEGADFCSDTLAEAPDYPFEVSSNYSNRRARAGRDPCDPTGPLSPIAVLAEGQPSPVDLSSGSATIVLDIFADDPSADLTLRATVALSYDNTSLQIDQVAASDIVVHDGDAFPLAIHLTLPFDSAPDVAQSTRNEIVIDLCPTVPPALGSGCGQSRISISRLPPVQKSPDAGVPDGG